MNIKCQKLHLHFCTHQLYSHAVSYARSGSSIYLSFIEKFVAHTYIVYLDKAHTVDLDKVQSKIKLQV